MNTQYAIPGMAQHHSSIVVRHYTRDITEAQHPQPVAEHRAQLLTRCPAYLLTVCPAYPLTRFRHSP